MVGTGMIFGGIVWALVFILGLFVEGICRNLPRDNKFYLPPQDVPIPTMIGFVGGGLLFLLCTIWFITIPLAIIVVATYLFGKYTVKKLLKYTIVRKEDE